MNVDQNVMIRARDFYAIYMASCSGLNFEGRPCPQWRDLNDAVRGHWYVVALRSLQLQSSDPEVLHLGEENKILPSGYVLSHLGDSTRVEQAVATWTDYSTDSRIPLTKSEVEAIRYMHEKEAQDYQFRIRGGSGGAGGGGTGVSTGAGGGGAGGGGAGGGGAGYAK